MSFWYLLMGAIISFAGMFFHGALGHKIYMENINQSDMEPLTKSLSLVSWHVFTIFLLISGVTLLFIAYNPSFVMAAYPIIGVNLLGSALFIFLGLGQHKKLLTLPGAYLMGSTAILALLGT